MKAFYWRRQDGIANFGDALTAFLLERIARIKCEWAPPDDAELVGVGSILEHIPKRFEGIVFGTGKARPDSRVNLSKARVVALRGPLTLQGSKARGDVLLGDPGLLCGLFAPRVRKIHRLGVIPH